jgi:glutamate synthase domain-containing protein 3
MTKQTELETLEQQIQSLLAQYRAETDPEKKKEIFKRRYYLRKKWHEIAPPWNVVGMEWDPNFVYDAKSPPR